MLTLYDLAISHYSEKARWALDYKGLEHRSRTLSPGYHILTVRRLGGGRTVPVLVDSEAGAVVNDSTDILHYLERLCPEPALFPDDPERSAPVLELEEFFDEHCARHVSGFFYHHLLDHPRVLAARWASGCPPLQRLRIRASMLVLPRVMRRVRNINEETAAVHRERVFAALDRVEERLAVSDDDYLVGGGFTAADLTAAAVLGPAVQPPGSPWDPADRELPSSEGFPPPDLTEFLQEVAARPAAQWVRTMWARHRRR